MAVQGGPRPSWTARRHGPRSRRSAATSWTTASSFWARATGTVAGGARRRTTGRSVRRSFSARSSTSSTRRRTASPTVQRIGRSPSPSRLAARRGGGGESRSTSISAGSGAYLTAWTFGATVDATARIFSSSTTGLGGRDCGSRSMADRLSFPTSPCRSSSCHHRVRARVSEGRMSMSPTTRPLRALVPERYKRPLKLAYGTLVSAAASFLRRHYDPTRSVLVLGSPRSGTTWLMNLVCASPGTAAVFEPLNPVQDPWIARLVTDEWLRLTSNDDARELERFLALVLAGRHLTRWSSNHSSLPDILCASRLVVKFVRAMRAAGWLARRFPANPKVAILRHPCAVVSSMVASPGIWN